MRKMFKTPHNIMLYRERTESQEFGLAKKDFWQCKNCGAVYHKKSWHHRTHYNMQKVKQKHHLSLTVCPACTMIANNLYEGQVIVTRIPQKFKHELQNLIKGYTKRAYQKDCQHRLIAITEDSDGNWLVTTTENQLANKLGRKIQDVFNKMDVTTAYSKAPHDVERVWAQFQTEETP